jgi:hypothetical protein
MDMDSELKTDETDMPNLPKYIPELCPYYISGKCYFELSEYAGEECPFFGVTEACSETENENFNSRCG